MAVTGTTGTGTGTVRITYDAEFEPGEIAGVGGDGLEVGQQVILVQPERVTEGPLEWPGTVEEVRERYGHLSATVRMAGRDITVSYADLRTVLDYARHFDVDEHPAMIRLTAAAERYRQAWSVMGT